MSKLTNEQKAEISHKLDLIQAFYGQRNTIVLTAKHFGLTENEVTSIIRANDYSGHLRATCPDFESHHSGGGEPPASSLFHGVLDTSLHRT